MDFSRRPTFKNTPISDNYLETTPFQNLKKCKIPPLPKPNPTLSANYPTN